MTTLKRRQGLYRSEAMPEEERLARLQNKWAEWKPTPVPPRIERKPKITPEEKRIMHLKKIANAPKGRVTYWHNLQDIEEHAQEKRIAAWLLENGCPDFEFYASGERTGRCKPSLTWQQCVSLDELRTDKENLYNMLPTLEPDSQGFDFEHESCSADS